MNDLKTPVEVAGESRKGTVADSELAVKEDARQFSLRERALIFLATWAGYFAVLLIGRTLRWEVFGWTNWEAARKAGKGTIYTFWHRGIFAGTWFFRKRGIVIMTSRNFDGEYIARIIKLHGYGAARGSSSRGASSALAEMIRCHRQGHDTGFAIDGPRGPRFVAKPGAVLLAKATGASILCFHFATRPHFTFRKSWDQTEFPLPFSRAAIFIAPPVVVPREATETQMDAKLKEVQAALDQVRARAEQWQAI